MSHFNVLVIVPAGIEDYEKEVGRLLEPYDENGERGEDGERPESRWDWWTIGGRWTGSLTGYDPYTDPANQKTCDLCGGTGDRAAHRGEPRDIQHTSGCNGCGGTGTRVAWTLQPYDGDVQPISLIADGYVPYAVVTPDGQWHEKARMGWWGIPMTDEKPQGDWSAEVARLYLAHRDHLAVVVDCHV